MRRRARQVATLADHPDAAAVRHLLARLPTITEDELTGLAGRWQNTPVTTRARDRALSPDSPLVLDVLEAFETVSVLFADDLRGAPHLALDRDTASLGVKAVRDAVAATYGRPVLTRTQHRALLAPWRDVVGSSAAPPVDHGPRAASVASLLAAVARLSDRCHDPHARSRFEALALRADASDAEEARREAWGAAVLTGRHRTSALLRRQAALALRPHCGQHRSDPRDEEQVLRLATDAATGLLVADALPEPLATSLTAPLADLIPHPRQAADG